MIDARPLSTLLMTFLLGMAAVFMLLGAFLLFTPAPGSIFFGYPTSEPSGLFYIRALGLRDIAVALYIGGLTLAGHRRPLFVMLAATIVIPLGDLTLLGIAGTAQPVNFVLHAGSLLCFAAMAIWVRLSARSDPR